MKPQRRTKLIQLIHVGKKEIGISDEDYRVMLHGATAKSSCTDMTVPELEAVLTALRRLGFQNPQRCGNTRVSPQEKGRASYRQLEYIKGMWAKCARNKNDEALLVFVNRIAHVKALRFLTVHTAQKVTLALRDMMIKAGFDPDTSEALNG
ncbi:GemA protein [Spirochaetia bacterium]|nr:GemA protein [Spirochaetia bacterium]